MNKGHLTVILLLVNSLFGTILLSQDCENHSIFVAPDSLTQVRLCPNDGIIDIVRLSKIDSSEGTMYSFIIADVRDNIISVHNDSILNFEGFGIGLCRIWGVSHGDSLIYQVGGDIISVRSRNGSCAVLSDNVINVIKEEPRGGTVELLSGLTDTTYCSLNVNNRDTAITVVGSALSGLYYTYVLTTSANRVISNNYTGVFDLSDLNQGNFNIYGLSYAGAPEIQIPADSSIFGFINNEAFCAELSSNNVVINKEIPDAGQIRANRVDTSVILCPEGGSTAKVGMRNTGSTIFNYIYLVTDQKDSLLATSVGDSIDFSGSPVGACRIYGLSYDGKLNAQIGESIFSQDLADICFDISDEYIPVHRIIPEAGLIIANVEGDFLTCPGDNLPDILVPQRREANDSIFESRYVITDVEKTVLDILNLNIIDFEGADEGICHVYSITFSGELLLDIGDTLGVSRIAKGCSDISDNFQVVKRFVPEGGEISTVTGQKELFLCTDQVGFVTIELSNNSSAPQNYNYVITNGSDRIIEIIDSSTYRFEELPSGAMRIWGVAYTSDRLLGIGDNLSFSSYSEGCFDLSDNFLEIISDEIDAGDIQLDDGTKQRFFCLGRQENTTVQLDLIGASNSNQQFILTDAENRIIQFLADSTFDFSSIGAGAYKIWNAAYTGQINVKLNENLLEIPFSNDCYDITEEPIRVIRDNPFAGEIRAIPGFSKAYTCPENDDLDFVKFQPFNAIYLDYAFIVTDSTDNIINFSFIDSIDFGLAEPGKCRVYGVSYEGNFTARIGNQLRNIAFSDECWDLSTNYVEIIRTSAPESFQINYPSGEQVQTVCVGDGGADLLIVEDNDPMGLPMAQVITDTNNVILDYSIGLYDFDESSAGQCRIYQVAYTGIFSASIGTDIQSGPYGDDCFTLSDNFVVVERVTEGPLCLVSNKVIPNNRSFFNIYPNPVTNYIKVELLEPGQEANINQFIIYDFQGKVLHAGELDKTAASFTIDLTFSINTSFVLMKLSNSKGEHWVERISIIK